MSQMVVSQIYTKTNTKANTKTKAKTKSKTKDTGKDLTEPKTKRVCVGRDEGPTAVVAGVQRMNECHGW